MLRRSSPLWRKSKARFTEDWIKASLMEGVRRLRRKESAQRVKGRDGFEPMEEASKISLGKGITSIKGQGMNSIGE